MLVGDTGGEQSQPAVIWEEEDIYFPHTQLTAILRAGEGLGIPCGSEGIGVLDMAVFVSLILIHSSPH